MQRRCYFAVDVEGSHGKPVLPGISNLISIGLVVVGNPDEHLYLEIRPFTKFWDPATEPIHLMTPAYLTAHGTDPLVAARRISVWVSLVSGDAVPVFCAMPLTYDWELFDLHFRYVGLPNPFILRQDGRAHYRQLHGLESHEDVHRERFERDYPSDIPHLHQALGDALEYEERIRPMVGASRGR